MSKLHKLSAVVLAKNEQDRIYRCLENLRWLSEIIVIDNGSSDRTKEIALEHHAKVYDCKASSFAELREYGANLAGSEWILYIDADEIVTSELKNEILKIIESKHSDSAYFIKRKNFYLGEHIWPVKDKMQRLFRRKDLDGWYGDLHESPKICGQTGELDNYLLHYTHRNLEDMLGKTNIWSFTEAYLMHQAKHPKLSWWRFMRVMLTSFTKSYISEKGYLAGTVGMIESLYQSFSTFISYAKLWEMQLNKEKIIHVYNGNKTVEK